MSLIILLACYYVTWVICASRFPLIALPRDAFVNRWASWDVSADPDVALDPKVSLTGHKTNIIMRSLAYLLECFWCMGFWVSMGFYLVLDKCSHVPFDMKNVLATSACIGILATVVYVVSKLSELLEKLERNS